MKRWTLSRMVGVFGGAALVWGGLATLAFGSVGILASQQLARLAGFSVIASSGTLVAAIGFGVPAGANIPTQAVVSTPATVSLMVGRSGMAAYRLVSARATNRSCPSFTSAIKEGSVAKLMSR